jgi:hypothetical protein
LTLKATSEKTMSHDSNGRSFWVGREKKHATEIKILPIPNPHEGQRAQSALSQLGMPNQSIE